MACDSECPDRSSRSNPFSRVWIFTILSRHNLSFRSFRHADIRIRPTVVEQVALPLPHQTFDEHHVWDLTDFLPFFFGSKYRSIGTRHENSRVIAIKQRYAGAIHQFIVGTVVDKNYSLRRNDWRRPWFSYARVKLPGTHRQDRHIGG